MTDETDSELVRRSLNSDDSAFADLIARYQGKIYAVIISHVRNFADAQDLTQNTFLTAYMKLKDLRNPNSFAAWMRRIAVNQCRGHGILQRRTEKVQEAYGDILAKSHDQADRTPNQADLWMALSQIPDDQRLVLTLLHLEKQSDVKISHL